MDARFGDYEVVAPLASGGMGGVYLATHRTTGDRVAIKVLDPMFANHADVVRRLYAERTVSARARHPGLVEIRSAARSADNVPYLVMELLSGETLAQIIERCAAIDFDVIARIGSQVAAALAALHRAEIVHCDVKPENVFVLDDGSTVKVIDFGVSRLVDEPPADESSIAGTPAYMAPEQWRGRPEPASDVYSFGCVMYELLTGGTPFDGSLSQLMLAHLDQRPARPSWLRAHIPAELERIVMRALGKDPVLRPSMTELATTLCCLAKVPAASETLRMAGLRMAG